MEKPDKVTVELTWHQLEAIVEAELKQAVEQLFVLEYDENKNIVPLDTKVLEAYTLVLKRYMGLKDHEAYSAEVFNRLSNKEQT